MEEIMTWFVLLLAGGFITPALFQRTSNAVSPERKVSADFSIMERSPRSEERISNFSLENDQHKILGI